jgi:hypothetical protein
MLTFSQVKAFFRTPARGHTEGLAILSMQRARQVGKPLLSVLLTVMPAFPLILSNAINCTPPPPPDAWN